LTAFFKWFGLITLLGLTWAVDVYHLGVYPKPPLPNRASVEVVEGLRRSAWIDKRHLGIHQLMIHGSPYTRGLALGKHTQHLLYREERDLTARLHQFFPNRWVLSALQVMTFRWFWGINRYLEPWTVEEMAGVAEYASPEFNYLADTFTRQVAYHGVHEVGQMMVDQTGDDAGCTVLAIPHQGAWIIGRNFDFEGARILDSEKIMKWVFPERGYAFVSVIWAGMVGVVTGVNQHGLYISLNAAGTTDFARYGTPSTLVLLKALQFSKTAEEALQTIKNAQMFITDIFVVSDRTTGKLFRVEKSPKATEIIELTRPSAITNHLMSARWRNDRINRFRRDELTSFLRSQRGEQLVMRTQSSQADGPTLEVQMLSFLRDKGEVSGVALEPGNRRAIDPLIATHSVIYNEANHVLYVGQGPGVSGPFVGFDLEASFNTHVPRVLRTLGADPAVSAARFHSIRQAEVEARRATTLARAGECAQASKVLERVRQKRIDSYWYHASRGEIYQCQGNKKSAGQAYRAALARHPAYTREVRALKAKLNSVGG